MVLVVVVGTLAVEANGCMVSCLMQQSGGVALPVFAAWRPGGGREGWLDCTMLGF
jgi:hypothetical protein